MSIELLDLQYLVGVIVTVWACWQAVNFVVTFDD